MDIDFLTESAMLFGFPVTSFDYVYIIDYQERQRGRKMGF